MRPSPWHPGPWGCSSRLRSASDRSPGGPQQWEQPGGVKRTPELLCSKAPVVLVEVPNTELPRSLAIIIAPLSCPASWPSPGGISRHPGHGAEAQESLQGHCAWLWLTLTPVEQKGGKSHHRAWPPVAASANPESHPGPSRAQFSSRDFWLTERCREGTG